ncbi:MAG: SGNH/GDSL hydrolase family protein [Nitrososphaera sp.]|nr:SGNH/GDSL hydrolase family protein [Nitrososphaera sp.]
MSSLLANLLLVFGSLIFFFSLTEIGTRLLWHQKVEPPQVEIILEGANREAVYEGILYRTNSLGLRNSEVQKAKTKGAKWILALGDSMVWGSGLSERDLITTQLKNVLREDFQEIAVINGGIAGFDTNDEFRQLVRLAPVYKPDLAIVFFFTNDVLHRTANEIGKKRAVSWRHRTKEFLRHKSKFFAFLYYLYKDKLAAKIGVPEFLLTPDYFNLNDSKPGWVAFKNATVKISNYCRENRIGLFFVMIPTLTNLDERYPYKELREKVRTFVVSNGIHLIDLFEVFAPYRSSDLWVSPENTHWNGRATALAAKEIAKNIRHRGMLTGSNVGMLGRDR